MVRKTKEQQQQPQDIKRGTTLMLLSALATALLGVFAKTATEFLSVSLVVFVACLFRVAGAVLSLVQSKATDLKTQRWGIHILRAVTNVLALSCFIYTLKFLPLLDAILLASTAPLFAPLIASFWLKEGISPRTWGGFALGLIGVLCVLKPGTDAFQPTALTGLIAGLFFAVTQVTARPLASTEPAERSAFYNTVLSTVLAALPVLFLTNHVSEQAWAGSNATTWGWSLAGAGLAAYFVQTFATRAQAAAAPSRIGIFGLTSIIFAGLIGWFLWAQTPSLLSIVGAVLTIAGVATVLRAEPTALPATAGTSSRRK